ncbi:MAG: HPP family protein [Jatrophihabitans sp.]|uniref:HPP family protein n=1 Tax=Jatrophihabitans sp. TaxID=1932789 RepID=UPI003F7D1C86
MTGGRVAAVLAGWRPTQGAYKRAEFLRGGLGALVGIVVAAVAGRLLDVGPAGLPYIVAPMGAAAVLLFAAPASPLAQPWPLLAGNIVSATIGVASGRLFDDVVLATSVAVGAAIAAMMLLRCLHPPGGACALFAAAAAPVVHHQGFLFPLFPIAVDSVFLLAVAVLVNNLTGRRYPHVPPVEPVRTLGRDVVPTQRLGVHTDDVVAAIARLDQGLDVHPGDVVALIRDAEQHALDRQLGRRTVETVMARDVLTVTPADTVYRVRLIIHQHHVKAVPVVDAERHVLGIVTIYDLFGLNLAAVDRVTTVMTSPVTTIAADAPVSDLVALMSDRGLRHIPVVDADGRLVGIVTRGELIAVLHRALLDSAG